MSLAHLLLVPGSFALLAVLLVLASWLESRLGPAPQEPVLVPVELPVARGSQRAA